MRYREISVSQTILSVYKIKITGIDFHNLLFFRYTSNIAAVYALKSPKQFSMIAWSMFNSIA